MLQTFAVRNYRTLRQFIVPLGGLTVVSGANGSGKSNLYRALRLLAETAQGGLVGALAREGGLDSTLWAGPETVSGAMRRGEVPVQPTVRAKPVSLALGYTGDDFSYAIDLGLPMPSTSAFHRDPAIKTEFVWAGAVQRPGALLVERRNHLVRSRGESGEWHTLETAMPAVESIFSRIANPRRTPELLMLRDRMRGWRFYDHFRSDATAPARQPQVGTYTPVLGHDGADLAAALQTIREAGDAEALDAAVHDAFPGARLSVASQGWGLEASMTQPGLLRPLRAAEFSDGTLRYLLWIAALLSPQPPDLFVLNEPETSLHPDLLPALGRLIAAVAARTQVIVVTHAPRLMAAVDGPDCTALPLEKPFGETRVAGRGEFDHPAWRWMPR